MALSKEEIDKIIERLNKVIKEKRGDLDFKCPVCTNNRFEVVEGFTNELISDKIGGSLPLGGIVLPSIPVICTRCGYTFFFNTNVLKLNKEDLKEPKKDG